MAKEQSINDSVNDNNGQGLAGVPESKSKIIHQPFVRQEVRHFVQYPGDQQQHEAQGNSSNMVGNTQQITGQLNSPYQQNVQQQQNSFQQQSVQQNSLRHTVGGGVQSAPYQTVNREMGSSNQSFSVRGSLPANTSPQHYVMMPNQPQLMHTSQQQPQFTNYQQPLFVPTQQPQYPNISMRQVSPHQVSTFSAPGFHQQQLQHPGRLPQHMPASLLPYQKIQSETLVEPVSFLKNGSQRL